MQRSYYQLVKTQCVLTPPEAKLLLRGLMAERPARPFGLAPISGIEVRRVGERCAFRKPRPIQPERQVRDGQSHLQEHRLVESLHLKYRIYIPFIFFGQG